MSDLLSINAHLKYVEFLLHIFDTGSDELSLERVMHFSPVCSRASAA